MKKIFTTEKESNKADKTTTIRNAKRPIGKRERRCVFVKHAGLPRKKKS